MIEVNVIGLGFVGLTTAVGFSHKKIKVNAIENNIQKLNKISKGEMPFYEPFLKENSKYQLKIKPFYLIIN